MVSTDQKGSLVVSTIVQTKQESSLVHEWVKTLIPAEVLCQAAIPTSCLLSLSFYRKVSLSPPGELLISSTLKGGLLERGGL